MLVSALGLVHQALPTRDLVTLIAMATLDQHQFGLDGAMASAVVLVVALAVAGEDGDLMGTLCGRF